MNLDLQEQKTAFEKFVNTKTIEIEKSEKNNEYEKNENKNLLKRKEIEQANAMKNKM